MSSSINIEDKIKKSVFGDDYVSIIENDIHEEPLETHEKEKKKSEKKIPDPMVVAMEDSVFDEEPPDIAPEIKEIEMVPIEEEKTLEHSVEKKEKEEEKNKAGGPKIIKKMDHKPSGKKANKEEIEKIKSIPQAFIIYKVIEKEKNVLKKEEKLEKKEEGLFEQTERNNKASENTQLLDGQICGKLVREEGKEEILLNKPIYRIGKSSKFADYVIRGNSAVSRRHVEIITRNERYYIRDKNSTNGTFVDGIQLPPETEMEIKDGQLITVANVNFEFYG